jgi:adenine deaminase
MHRATSDERRVLADVALGRVPADLVVRGGRVVEVHTGAIVPADVAIKGARIAAVGSVDHTVGAETEIYDADGAYLAPGFIDCHLHVGGSQLGMTELARLLISHGTAAISTCFYEAGTIGGFEAIRFFVEEARATPLKVLVSPFLGCYLGLGSCGNPGRFAAEDLTRLLAFPECVEIREWNANFESVPVPGVREFVDEARASGKVIAGHLEGLTGPVLQASVALGASSDHEIATAEEAVEKARLGVRVQLRQGSAARDLENVLPALTRNGIASRCFMFATDEEEAHRLDALGHVDLKLRLTVAAGVEPVVAVQIATLNAAEYLRVSDDLGSIAPGRLAHVNVLDELREFAVRDVIADGRVVVRDGRFVVPLPQPAYPASFRDTIRLRAGIGPADFAIAVEASGEARLRVIGLTEGSLLTEERVVTVPVDQGMVAADPGRDLAKICVFDRHDSSERVGRGLVQGLGLASGAFAASFNPGLMNVMAVGVNDLDLSVCVNRVAKLGGGAVAAVDGKVVAEVALPLLGIVSDRPAEEVVEQMRAFDCALREQLGCAFDGVLTGVGFTMCAIAIPSLKICDAGLALITRETQELVDLVVLVDEPVPTA